MEQLGDLQKSPDQRVSRVAGPSATREGESLTGGAASKQPQLAATQHLSHDWDVILENLDVTNKEASANLPLRGLRHVCGVLTVSITASRNEVREVRLCGNWGEFDGAQDVPARPPKAEAQPTAAGEEVDDVRTMRISHGGMVPPILIGYRRFPLRERVIGQLVYDLYCGFIDEEFVGSGACQPSATSSASASTATCQPCSNTDRIIAEPAF